MIFENGTHVHYIHTHDAARNVLSIQAHGERGAMVRMEALVMVVSGCAGTKMLCYQ